MKKLTLVSPATNLSILFSLCLIIVLFFTGCTFMKVSSDYDKNADYKAYKTFNFTQSIEGLRVNADNKEIIKSAIINEMNARGYKKSNSINADIWIHLFIVINKSVETTEVYSTPMGANPYQYSFGFSNTSVDFHNYTEGTLIIDIVDGTKKEIIWEGRASTPIDKDGTETEKEKLINKIVKKIFKKYPVPAAKE
jgi:hypothetical protein